MPKGKKIPIKKIDDYRWRISKDFNKGMRVDGLIYADERLARKAQEDNAVEQVANVAHLPGIVKYSLAMPDLHWGYGFVIGGVAAMDVEKDGIVTPGGIGYDINCLTGDSKILHKQGYFIDIRSMEESWKKEHLRCEDFTEQAETETEIIHYLKLRPKNSVYQLVTESGDTIKATADHPFWTPDGMVELENLQPGDRVAMNPFLGVVYEEPSDEVIVSREDVKELLHNLDKDKGGHELIQILNHLESRELLPLRYNSPHLPALLKILGYLIGDGTLRYVGGNGKGRVNFYGEQVDLECIREEIKEVGFTPSRIYTRHRDHCIETTYGKHEFSHEETSFRVSSSAFATLLVALGMPIGSRAEKDFTVPKWLFDAPLWQKRLFLASFFGAELSTPNTVTGHPYTLAAPTLSINKREGFVESGEKFLREIAHLLVDFDVEVQKISKRKEQTNKDGSISYRLRLGIKSTSENLRKFWKQIGFEYNTKRKVAANVALQYLKHKEQIIAHREKTAEFAAVMHAEGVSPKKIFGRFSDENVNKRFIERSIYGNRKGKPRIPKSFPTFEEYFEEVTEELGQSGMLWERIEKIKPTSSPEYVYDFTVKHPDHNFIANGFVVSNCGVRLVRTNLELADVKDKVKDLTDALFNKIPCGVGSKGSIRLSNRDEKAVLEKGTRWTVENGYGVPEDIDATEEGGCMELADASTISKRALDRGRKQLGTLGSGNHFLEIQVVDEIFNRKAANVLGLFEDQIAVMIHTGSRGFGHQVCDEHVKTWSSVTQKYNIDIPDRQLVSAPIDSQEGQEYISAMACAANYAWANRQCIMHWTREVFEKSFNTSFSKLGLELVYDVAHNIGKFESHMVDGKKRRLFIHRKGATRAFPPGHPDVPKRYRSIGQPVIIPGDMGTASYVLVGTQTAMDETWGTTCHGAGRTMSRRGAIRSSKGRSIRKEMENQGIHVRWTGRNTLKEEQPDAYKDVNRVVEVVDKVGISKKVARMRPLGVIKG